MDSRPCIYCKVFGWTRLWGTWTNIKLESKFEITLYLRKGWLMSRGPFQTNVFNGFMSFLIWSRNPEMPASRIHQTWQLCKTFKLSNFCFSRWTIKWSKVRGRERAGAKAFSCTSNLMCFRACPGTLLGKRKKWQSIFSLRAVIEAVAPCMNPDRAGKGLMSSPP